MRGGSVENLENRGWTKEMNEKPKPAHFAESAKVAAPTCCPESRGCHPPTTACLSANCIRNECAGPLMR